MTIAATNFLSAMTGGAPTAGAATAPVAAFLDAIESALADPGAAPLAETAFPAAPQPVLPTGLVGEVALGGSEIAPRAKTPTVSTAETMQPVVFAKQAPPDPLAAIVSDPIKLTVCVSVEPTEEPQVALLKDLPFAELPLVAEDIEEVVIGSPEPPLPNIVKGEAGFPVAAPWSRHASNIPAPVVASGSPEIAQASPSSSGSPSTADARIDAPQASASPAATPAFADRLPVAVTSSPAPEGASIATVQSAPIDARPTAVSAEPGLRAAPPEQPIVNARSGQIGREMGVEIARHLSAGGDELTVRLNPAEMGRIEVRLSFDEGGTLRAVVAAESAAALDMLRRDSADLGRALTDAGVRADAQSFRFDSRSNGGEGSQFWQRQQQGGRQRGNAAADHAHTIDPVYRPLRASGRIDLLA